MPNEIKVILTAEDAELVQAWQRGRDNVAQYADQVKKSGEEHQKMGHHGAESFESISSGVKKTTNDLAGMVVGFKAVEKGADLIHESFREWVKDLEDAANKERDFRVELTKTLALQGKLHDEPEVEKRLEKITGASKEQKLIAFKAVGDVAPGLNTDEQMGIVDQTAKLGRTGGEEAITRASRAGAVIKQVDPSLSPFEAANLGKVASDQARGRAGELADPASLRSLEILHHRAGMSMDESLAFETTAMKHGLGSKDVEKVTDELVKDVSPEKLGKPKSHEDLKKHAFYREHDAKKRLALIEHDKMTRDAILGGKESERFGDITAQEREDSRAQLSAGRQGTGAIVREQDEHARLDPDASQQADLKEGHEKRLDLEAKARGVEFHKTQDAKWKAQWEKDHGTGYIASGVEHTAVAAGKTARYLEPDWLRHGRQKQGLEPVPPGSEEAEEKLNKMDAEGPDLGTPAGGGMWGNAASAIGRGLLMGPIGVASAAANAVTPAAAVKPKLVADQPVLERSAAGGAAPDDERQQRTSAGQSLQWENEHRQGGSAPAGHHDAMLQHTAEQTQLLRQIAANKPQPVNVAVHTGGGSSRGPRVSTTERAEPSWSSSLGANH